MTVLTQEFVDPMKNSKTSGRTISFQGTSKLQDMSIGPDTNAVTTTTTTTTNNNNNSSSTSLNTASSSSTAAAAAADGSQSSTAMTAKQQQPRAGKRPGRKPSKINERDKLERSRQSARECRARKKLRYQYLEELVGHREKAVCAIRDELSMYKRWCYAVDQGDIPASLVHKLQEESPEQSTSGRHSIDSDDAPEIISFSPYNDLDLG